LWGSNEISWVHRSVELERWGILTLWNNKVFMCDRIEQGNGYIVIEGKYRVRDGNKVVQVGIVNCILLVLQMTNLFSGRLYEALSVGIITLLGV